MTIPAAYFDGKTSRKYNVTLSVAEGIATIAGDIARASPLGDLRVSERGRNAPRKVTFADGAYLEVQDNDAFNQLLSTTGFEESFVVGMQQSGRGILIAVLLTLAVLVLGYVYGLPALSEVIAKALPQSIDRSIGEQTLSFLDQGIMKPSKLPEARRNAIVARFKTLAPPKADVPEYEIIFRKSSIGPNAFALPSGQIIVTDEIVALLDNDDAVMSVLAHELGHLHERHLMRRVIQSSAIAGVVTVMFGDVSAVIANVPTLLLDMKYSRDAELEADDYAIAMLKANGVSLSNMAKVFQKLGEKTADPSPYLSSHPSSAERLERIKRAQ